MLEKQLGHPLKHRAARVIAEKENTGMEDYHDDAEVQAERKEIENEVGKQGPKHRTPQEDTQGEGDNANMYNIEDTIARYEMYLYWPKGRVSGSMMEYGLNHSRKALKRNVCKKQTTGQMIKRMFVGQLGQIQKEIGQPKSQWGRGGIPWKTWRRKSQRIQRLNYEEESARERATQTITIPVSVGQQMETATEKLTREQKNHNKNIKYYVIMSNNTHSTWKV